MTQTFATPLSTLLIPIYYKGGTQKSFEIKIRREVKKISTSLIKSCKPFEKSIQKFLPIMFEIRIEVMKWAIKKNINFQDESQKLLRELEKIYNRFNKPEDLTLLENTMFTIKTSIYILNSIFLLYQLSSEQLLEEIKKIKTKISYNQLRVAVELEPLPDKIKKLILEILDVSLSLDLCLILAGLFIFGECKLSSAKKIELSRLLRDLAQKYGALAMELQLWKLEYEKIPRDIPHLTSTEIKEEQQLAEAGMPDYLRQVIEEENE